MEGDKVISDYFWDKPFTISLNGDHNYNGEWAK